MKLFGFLAARIVHNPRPDGCGILESSIDCTKMLKFGKVTPSFPTSFVFMKITSRSGSGSGSGFSNTALTIEENRTVHANAQRQGDNRCQREGLALCRNIRRECFKSWTKASMCTSLVLKTQESESYLGD